MRDKAFKLLKEYNSNPSLIKHALAVEGVMRYFAKKAGEDEEYWGTVGLLHDLDYEKYPEEHCQKAIDILRENDYSEDFIRSIISHGYGILSEEKPTLYMEKVLYSIDELTGLITATALMRPSKSVMDLEVKSVKKKFKDKGFAASIDRNIIRNGSEMLEITLEELIDETISGMREIHEDLEL